MSEQGSHYEFSADQNVVLEKTALWIRLFAWIMMVSAALMALGGLLSGEAGSIVVLVLAAVYFMIGLTFRDASVSMNSVVDTQGNDIEHLMVALDKLGSALKTMAILVLIGVAISVAATVAIWAWMSSLPS